MILTTALKASAVNLLIIVGSELGVLDRGVLPAIRAFGAWAYLPEGAIASAITSAAASVGLDYDPLPMPQSSSSSSPSSYSTHSSSSSATYPPPEWVPQLCAYIFYVLWLFPIWLLVYLAVNIGTYSEVATLAHEQRPQHCGRIAGLRQRLTLRERRPPLHRGAVRLGTGTSPEYRN